MSSLATGHALAPQQPQPRGLLAALGSTDHKRIGTGMFTTAFGFFIAAGLLALAIRSELLQPGSQIVGAERYDQLFTLHGSTMFYLFASPIALGAGLYLVPLQIGARRVALPRVALGSWWLLLFGGLTMWMGFLTTAGAADVGWYAYFPLTNMPNSPGVGTDYWIVGVIMAGLSGVTLAICLLTTVVKLRAPGMTMLRLPVFTWAIVITSLMVITAYPALVAAMALTLAQRHLGGVFNLSEGPIAYQNLFWFFGHPVVYVVFFPFLGAVAESVAVFSGRRWFGYRPFVVALLGFAALSMSVWGHHMFTTGAVDNHWFAVASTALIVPAGIEYFDSLATMWRGRIRFTPPMLFALGFLVLFLAGGLTGVWVGSPPLNYQVTDSYFIVAHFHYTLFGGSVMGLFAAIYLWWPKVTGTLLSDRLGRWHFYLTFVGTNVTFLPMFFLGLDGMPRRIADYPAGTGWQTLNDVASAGSYLIGLSILVFLLNVGISLLRARPAGDNPWNAYSLEWATSSPPPPENFSGPLPPVRSFAPLLDLREQQVAWEAGAAGAVALGAVGPVAGGPGAAVGPVVRGPGAAGSPVAGPPPGAALPARALSYATVLGVLGFAFVLVGLVVGQWLWMIGCGVVALALVSLLLQQRAGEG
ncbi:MAG TPA: cbb3-type cytochrome c oxidase subunit I [Conexibacter sp.]|jgi:cytochrome c oxidase subunit 1